VGSGAGLPGIVLAIGRPDLGATLVEPLQRRVTFLQAAIDELGLGERVEVLHGRAEDFDAGRGFDVVTSRAVGALTKLVGWSAPLMARDGVVLALKGASAEAEIEKAAKELRKAGLVADVLQVRADPRTELTFVVRLRRA
jgi:16S rRNA (guanine527-N7)-methyltransferase